MHEMFAKKLSRRLRAGAMHRGANMLKGFIPIMGMLIISNPAASVPITFSNTGVTTIPASGTTGPATPYPSTIGVSGFTGLTTNVTATLFDMSHTFPDDIDILLVGPTGLKTLLMSDAGGGSDIVSVTLTFADAASGFLPDSTQIVSGSYKPTNYGSGDLFPPPAPAGPYTADPLSVFNGSDPNGTWSLYVVDDIGGDVGSIAGGWSLTIDAASVVPEPSSMLLLGTGLVMAVGRHWRKSRMNG